MKYLVYVLLRFLHPIFLKFSVKRLRVLAYHTVPDQEAFRLQMEYLSSTYHIIDIFQLKNHLFYKKPLPDKSLLITFDDGDVSVLENALPVLKRYNLPSVLFIITGLINTNKMFWCRQVEKVFQENGKSYKNARLKIKELKENSNLERVNYLKGIRMPDSRQLASEELLYMEENQMFIGNHTHSHPMVNMCNKEEMIEEFQFTFKKFKDWSLDGYSIFAYPNGNWDSSTETLLNENGIEIAFLFDHKLNKKNIDPLKVSRLRVDSDTNLPEFKVKVSGLHSILMHSKQKISRT